MQRNLAEAWVIASICAAFVIPVVLVLTELVLLNGLRRARGYALVLAFIIATSLSSPPNVVEASLRAVFVYLAYEAGLLLARTLRSRRR